MISAEFWDDLFTLKLRNLLSGRNYPLPLLGVEAVNSWFQGVGEHSEVIRYLLSNVTDSRVSLVEVDGIEYFSFMSQLRWETTVSEARRLVAAGAEEHWIEDYCRVMVGGLLPEHATEFGSLLWEKASELCVFVDQGEKRVLRAYGRGAEQVITGVLEDSPTPLHYSEIAPV